MKHLLIALTLSAGLLSAQPNAGGLKTYLGLSDTQVSALQQIREQSRKEVQPLRQTIQDKTKALRDQTQAGSTDTAALGQLVIDVRNARQQVEPIRTRAKDQALAVLTPDQKAKLADLKTNAKQRRELRQASRLGLLDDGGNGQRGRLGRTNQ